MAAFAIRLCAIGFTAFSALSDVHAAVVALPGEPATVPALPCDPFPDRSLWGQTLSFPWGQTLIFMRTAPAKCLLKFWGQTLRNAVFSMGTDPSKVGMANNFRESC